MSEDPKCVNCRAFQTKKCPKCEYKDGRLNWACMHACCLPTDEICKEFEAKKATKKKKEKKPKLIYRDSGYAHEGYFEAIYHEDKPYFLVLNDDLFSLVETVSYNKKKFTPKDIQRIPYKPYQYFEGPIPDRERLFRRIRAELEKYIDVEPIWLDVLAACILLSYQQEKLVTVPYLYFYGDNESGKSTVLQLLNKLCYRPMYGVTVPAADIYGYLEDLNSIGCILEDELQGIDRDTDKIKIYKAGYKEGAVVPRTLMTQHDRIIKFYNTFSFKACASEQIPSVKGFRERFIEISMVEGYPQKEWSDVTPEDLKRLQDLRNILLKWRMLTKKWQLPNPQVQMKGRLKELWKPILQVTHGLPIYDKLSKFIQRQKNERLAAKQDTLEGHIVKVITELYNKAEKAPEYVVFTEIWFALCDDLEGRISDDRPNIMDTSEFFTVSKRKVGYRLREILSGKSKVVREGKDTKKAYEFKLNKLARIAKKYGYKFEKAVTKLSLLSFSKGVCTPELSSKIEREIREDTPSGHGNIENIVTYPSDEVLEKDFEENLPEHLKRPLNPKKRLENHASSILEGELASSASSEGPEEKKKKKEGELKKW